MNKRMKILTVFGTRPEAIKLFPLVHALEKDARFLSKVCVSGQHRGMLDQVLDLAGIEPDIDLDLMRTDQSLDQLTANLLTGVGSVLDRIRPNWVVVQGDTATAMGGALAAYYRKIPVAHVEAGLRSGEIYSPWPEEAYRKIIGSVAELHFAPTEVAAGALRRENIPAEKVHVTGNTVIDALHWVDAKSVSGSPGGSVLRDCEARFAGKKIIGVTTHRRENLGDGMDNIISAVAALAERPDVAIILPVHPNPNVRAKVRDRLGGLPNVALTDPLSYPDFVRLLRISTLMLTDSGGVQEEAPALGKPVLVMRDTTERPEGVLAGTAKLVGTDTQRIIAETQLLLDDNRAYAAMAMAHNPYGDGQAASRIVELLAGEGKPPRMPMA
ncbi:UDP-N-acetylglucosamine 2-epimerase [Tsuneonella deserti]|uniref:UDP-N-acetylglucosamine 2-epimerase (non-hydrolyzing) n=1 Tax=Tsuneonella deserti TaxID=2035528 RepID=A0ABQ1SAC4_9SPHN|nr:UDP-N-acetylglucosamine 2-epimerase (non-hydrolyzing) [Tsuneonella deserti]GGE03502.1 UDP-N-acetylglucosamine 2-epimerase [Tsuneonella deserti]